jgi:membrane-associated PAP2 superfamily phosphatase
MPDMSTQQWDDRVRRLSWRRHALLPGTMLALLFAVVILGRLDLRIADAFFFNWPANEWIGAHSWWAVDLIHTGGGWLVRLIGLAALATLVAGFWLKRWRGLRRGAAYLTLGLILVPTIVGSLKQVTNVDCPWDLDRYGGDRPYVSLFADWPDDLPLARCYPGSHSSSGFALMAVFFLLRASRPRLARWSLAGALLVGVIFSLGQQARGAHFLSHDLASAAIAWFLLLGLAQLMLSPSRESRRQPGVESSAECRNAVELRYGPRQTQMVRSGVWASTWPTNDN